MKTSKQAPKPQVIRSMNGIFVELCTRSGASICICRRRYQKYGGSLGTPKWSAKRKAAISWSGHSSDHKTAEQISTALEMARFMNWAAQIAEKLNVRNPDKLTNSQLCS